MLLLCIAWAEIAGVAEGIFGKPHALSKAAADAIRALALTGCRKREILQLRGKQVDVDGRCLRLADTKTGKQLRPVGQSAAELLVDRRPPFDEGWVFPSTKGDGPLVNIAKPLAKLCEAAELQNVTAHVFRHSFATVAHELGCSELTIAGLLGHSAGSVTARYAHHVDSVLAEVADRASATIKERLGGRNDASG